MTQKLTIGPTDVSAYLQYASLTVKLNTVDLTLIDSIGISGGVTLGVTLLVLKDPNWAGTVNLSRTADLVDVRSGHYAWTLAATNTAVALPYPSSISATFGDQPSVGAETDYELEDASGPYLLEAGTAFANTGDAYALEVSTDVYGYQGLSQTLQLNTSDQSTTQLWEFTTFQPGVWPGMTIKIISNNLNEAPTVLVTLVTVTWQGANPPQPRFDVVAGTFPPTLQAWRLGG